ALPLDVPRHGGQGLWRAVPRRAPREPGALGKGADRAQDPPEPARERQGVPERVPLPRRAVVSANPEVPMDTPTDFERDLARMDLDLADLEAKARRDGPDLDVQIRLAGRRYHRAALTGVPADVGLAEDALRAALAQFPGAPDLCLIKA